MSENLKTQKTVLIDDSIVQRYSWWSGPYRLQFNCTAGHVDFTAVEDNLCPFKKDHWGQQIGAISETWFQKGEVHGKIRFTANETADDIHRMMEEGIRPGVSSEVDFADEHVTCLDQDGGDKGPLFFIDYWSLEAAASVDKPAFRKAKVYFSDELEKRFNRVHLSKYANRRQSFGMEPTEKEGAVATLTRAEMREQIEKEIKMEQELEKLRADSKAQDERFQAFLKEQKEKEEKAAKEFAEKLREVQYNPNPFMDMRGLDRSPNFSIGNLIRARAFRGDSRYEKEANVEINLVNSIDQTPVAESNFGVGDVIPHGKLMESGFLSKVQRRSRMAREHFQLNTGNIGDSVQTTVDLERAYQWLVDTADFMQYCQVIPGLTSDLRIPVGTDDDGADVAFKAEGSDPTQNTPAIGSIHLQPKEMTASIRLTKLSIQQTGGWLDAFIRNEMGRRFGEQINYYMLRGTGMNNQPLGVLNKTGRVDDLRYTTASPKYSEFTEVLGTMVANKIPINNGAWAMAGKIWGTLQAVVKDEGSGKYIVSDGEGMGDNPRHTTAGYPAKGTALLPAGRIVFGSWWDAFVGLWAGMQFVIDPLTKPTNVNITAIQWWDFQIPRGKSFVDMTGK